MAGLGAKVADLKEVGKGLGGEGVGAEPFPRNTSDI